MSKDRFRKIKLYGTAYEDLKLSGESFLANDDISSLVSEDDIHCAKINVERLMECVMEELLIDWRNDPNTQGTPKRYAKMLVEEAMRGRFYGPPRTTTFPNTKKLDEMYTTGPITVNSMCSHHLVPIVGRAWIGVIPGDNVIGLSKFNRIVEWVCRRPQIQEELVVQIADALESRLSSPRGLAVVVEATHMCMTWRGVEESSQAVMRTNVMRGRFMESDAARAEFFAAVK
jgi:GTP cyclohydrolase I